MRDYRLFGVLFACLAICGPAIPGTAAAQSLDLDSATAAKVAKEKAKARGAEGVKGGGRAADQTVVSKPGECGVNIGNIDTSKSGPGKPVATPRETTVVITGPVINLGKCK